MLGHPGGEEHSRYLIELAFLPKGTNWLDMGAGDGSTVRLLRNLGYRAEGIDLEPRGKDVQRGDYLDTPWQDGFFDGIISQCSFYLSGNVPQAVKEASRMLRKGGVLALADLSDDGESLLSCLHEAGFSVRHMEDMTAQWKEYYLEALWKDENTCIPTGKGFSYVLFVCERV